MATTYNISHANYNADLFLYTAFIFLNNLPLLCLHSWENFIIFERFFFCKPDMFLRFLFFVSLSGWSYMKSYIYYNISNLHTLFVLIHTVRLSVCNYSSTICESVLVWEWNEYACEGCQRFPAPLALLDMKHFWLLTSYHAFEPFKSLETQLSQLYYHPSIHTYYFTILLIILLEYSMMGHHQKN